MSQSNSKTEKLMYQNSYRKHRERLADIRHNVTTQEFRAPARYRIEDKKRQMIEKMKQEQIESQNNFLQQKIGSLKGRANSHLTPAETSIEAANTQFVRYEGNFQPEKLEVRQNFIEGESVKVVVPGVKVRALSFAAKSKGPYLPWVKPQLSTKYESNKLIPKKAVYSSSSEKRVEIFNATSSERVIVPQKKSRLLFNQPQRNENRQVLHKKTIILSPSQSCLLELSLLQDRMLIAAYLMGLQSHCIKEVLSAKKTLEVMKEYEGNYEQFCSKITVEQLNEHYQLIKLPHREGTIKPREKVSSENRIKEKAKVQQEFLKRNYYTLLKNEEESPSKSIDKPTITHQKVQQIVERLAAPKRYFTNAQIYNKKNVQPEQTSKGAKPALQSKVVIHIDGQKLAQRRVSEGEKESKVQSREGPVKQSTNKQPQRYEQARLALKKTDSIDYESESNRSPKRSEKKSQVLESFAKNVEKIKKNDEEEEVQYLDGQQQYGQEFQNPSEILKTANQANLSKSDVKKQDKPTKQEGSKRAKEQAEPSPQYEELFEQAQNYEQTFELQPNGNGSKLKESGEESRATREKAEATREKAKAAEDKAKAAEDKAKAAEDKAKEIEEQQYAEQFQG